MATRRTAGEQRPRKGETRQPDPMDDDLALAEELLRPESPAERAAILRELKKFRQFLEQQGIPVPAKPVGPKKLREMAIREGLNPDGTEFSRGIIEMREE